MHLIHRVIILLSIFLVGSPYLLQAQAPVIVELFTSQGCSSCPAADRLINDLANKKNIIPLSFHVDYWDYLGWKDPFSQAQFSDRQRAYAAHYGSGSIYTPQLIVNGKKEMVGSNAEKVNYAIDEELNAHNTYAITLHTQKINDRKVALSYSLPLLSVKVVLHIALVQKHTTTQILRGENRGKQLINNNVVTSFSTLSTPQQQGTLDVSLPAHISSDNLLLVVFAQNNADYHIVAVGTATL